MAGVAFWLGLVTLAAAWMAVGAVRLPGSAVTGRYEEIPQEQLDEFKDEAPVAVGEIPYRSVFFLKFHKVGSSTAAVRIGAAAVMHGFSQECEVGGNSTFCVSHDSLKLMRDISLGPDALSRIEARYPSPFMVTIMRHPVEKFASFIFYKAWLDKVIPTDAWFRENLDMLWQGSAEYTKVTAGSDTKPDLAEALHVLTQFHVVGLTEDMSGTLAQVGYHMQLTAQDMAYMSVTTMPGRPKLEDMSIDFRSEAYRVMATDYPGEMVLYDRATDLHGSRMDQYDLHGMREEIESLSKAPEDMECDEKVSTAHVRAGGNTCIDPSHIRDSGE